jgi:outer membrane receptor protein involved in Fe transport
MKPIADNLRLSLAASASALALIIASPAFGQTVPEPQPGAQGDVSGQAGGQGSGGTRSATAASADADQGIEEIVVTAQRQAESLQDVPIAVSAFSAEALDRQQIENSSDLQLTLPNVTFTKTNFTSSSFTIRGIGDLCVGVTCDSATAIHINESPLLGTRLFETEFFDLERVEVLRGPQGTLFGRNATSGVVNFVTAKPNLNSFQAAAEGEYGNYDSIKAKGMINLPVGDTLGVRVAGFYLNRNGFTKNLFDNSRIDGRDLYAVRGSVRWEPTDATTVDLMAYYFRENDDRLRIQKQLCQRDPTGVLGCLPARLDFSTTNTNSTVASTLSSREFLTIQGGPALGPALAPLALGSLYTPGALANFVNPADKRVVNTDTDPTYFADEKQFQARLDHDFGNFNFQLTGIYADTRVDSSQDYNLSVQNPAGFIPGLTALQNYAALVPAPIGPALGALLAPTRAALIPNGPNGPYCTSQAEETGTGAFGGFSVCTATPLDFDRSNSDNSHWSGEAIVETDFDGPVNFLLGGIYAQAKLTENSYYVNSFALDYVAGVLGAVTTLGQRLGGNAAFPPVYIGTPFFRNNTDHFKLKSYGIFGEAYWDVSDRLKLTAGLRYNNDDKSVRARSTLLSFPVPIGATDAFASPFVGQFDADPGRAGNQILQVRNTKSDEITGRAVLDFKVTDDNLLYASYSRGYKSGGINPPLQPIFAVPESFAPETIDAFEIGSKNTFLDGTVRLNATAFYYKYKELQLSRIVARTSVNDNVDANIYGLELESILQPAPELLFNINFSYLHTKVSTDKFLANPRDPSGGRSDAVIIKDITNGSNCAVVPNTAGNAAATNAFVGAVNQGIGASVGNPALLRGPTAFPADSGLAATGAFGICSALQGAIASPAAPLRAAFATATGPLPFTVETAGVPVNIKGNELPQAPNYKVSAGAQYTFEFGNGMSLVPRADIVFTGDSYGTIFNSTSDQINSFTQVNAQVQLNGPDERWYVRGFVQNLTNSDSTTGLYVTDASSGLFTNIFTLDPRRYGIAAGVKF